MIPISGAASRMARSTVVRSVTADDGQPSQLPSRRRCTAPTSLVDVEQLDVAAVTGEERSHRLERPGDACVEVVGMQAVGDEQAGHQLVGR